MSFRKFFLFLLVSLFVVYPVSAETTTAISADCVFALSKCVKKIENNKNIQPSLYTPEECKNAVDYVGETLKNVIQICTFITSKDKSQEYTTIISECEQEMKNCLAFTQNIKPNVEKLLSDSAAFKSTLSSQSQQEIPFCQNYLDECTSDKDLIFFTVPGKLIEQCFSSKGINCISNILKTEPNYKEGEICKCLDGKQFNDINQTIPFDAQVIECCKKCNTATVNYGGGSNATKKCVGFQAPPKETIIPDIKDFPNPLKAGITDPQTFIANLIKTFLGIIGSLALGLVVWGGVVWMSAAGDSERLKSGQKTVVWALIGIAAIFVSAAVVQFIIKAIG